MKPYWMPLKEAEDAALVGGKAYQMSRLIARCNNTPDGVAVTTEMMKRFLNLSGASDEIIKKAFSLEEAELEKVRNIVRTAKWPDEIKEELRKAYGLLNGSVCVRSSAVSEDGKEHSFAGVYRSNLNLRTFGEFLWGIRDCWLSAVDENAVVYASAVKEKLTMMALVVQPLLNSVKSGIAVIEGDVLTVSATYGQGQGAVSGQVSCDTYKVNRNGEKLFERINEKHTCYVECLENYPVWYESVYRLMDDGYTQGFYVNNTDDRNAMLFCNINYDQFSRYSKSVLSDDQLSELGKTLFSLSDEYSGNWDFEWSITNDGGFHILQARPLLSVLEAESDLISEDAEEDIFAKGVPISKGEASGKVTKIIKDEDMMRVSQGDIVAIDWIPESCISILNKASGLIIGESSVISHCAIIAREWGIPCVGGIDKSILVDGSTYCINGTRGTIKIAAEREQSAAAADEIRERIQIKRLNLLFWLVLSVDNIVLGKSSAENTEEELSELLGRYIIEEGVDITGISGCNLENSEAEAALRMLSGLAYKKITDEGYTVFLSEADKKYLKL